MNRFVLTAAAAALLVGAGQQVRADATLSYHDADGKPVSSVYVRGDRVRVERGADGFAMIADTGAGTLTMIDHRSRSYTVLDRQTIEAMGEQMKQMQQMMQAQMENLTEEQRDALAKQMPGLAGAGGANPQPTVTETGERRSIGGRDCEVVRLVMGGQTMFTACVAATSALGLSAQDAATLQAMAALLEEFGRGGGAQMSAMIRNAVPVETTNPHSGRPETLASVETGAVEASWFELPDGYTQKAMPKMGMPAQ